MPPLPKPARCVGCPLHAESGASYCPDLIREQAPLYVVSQNPGADEIAQGQPKVGKTGQMQARNFFPKAGVTRDDVSLGNVIRCRWKNSNELPPPDSVLFRTAAKHCDTAYGRIPEGTKLLVAEGDYAAVVHTREKVGGDPADSWRGFLRPHTMDPDYGEENQTIWHPSPHSLPVFVTQHTAYLFRNPAWQPVLLRDWGKIGKVLRGTWPVPCPPIETAPLPRMPAAFAFDTEFSGATLTRWSAAWSVESHPHVLVVEAGGGAPTLVPGTHLIVQNALADIGFLPQIFGDGMDATVDDTMYAHQLLFSDLPHNLNFLGSIYSTMNRWKHLGAQHVAGDWMRQGDHAQHVLYSGADAWGTWEVWQRLLAEFARDPQSWWLYRNIRLPLIAVIDKAQRRGMRVNQTRLAEAMNQLAMTAGDAQALGQASVGFPINLASPAQVGDYLYRVQGMSPRRKP